MAPRAVLLVVLFVVRNGVNPRGSAGVVRPPAQAKAWSSAVAHGLENISYRVAEGAGVFAFSCSAFFAVAIRGN